MVTSERNMVYIIRQVRWKLGVSYIVSKSHVLSSTNGLKLVRRCYLPSANTAFHFIARLRRQISANGTWPSFAKRWTVNRANNNFSGWNNFEIISDTPHREFVDYVPDPDPDVVTCETRAHHGDEIPERDETYHLTCLLIYHWTTTHL